MKTTENNKENTEFQKELSDYFSNKELLDDSLMEDFLSSIEWKGNRIKTIRFAYNYKTKRLVFERSVLGKSVFMGLLKLTNYKKNTFIKEFFEKHTGFNYELYKKENRLIELEEIKEGFRLFLQTVIIPRFVKHYKTALTIEQFYEDRAEKNCGNLLFYRRANDYDYLLLLFTIVKQYFNGTMMINCDTSDELIIEAFTDFEENFLNTGIVGL